MKPWRHARNSVKKHGGLVEDYLPIHDFIDSSKIAVPDMRHRAMLHSAWGVYLVERVFGTNITNTDGRTVSTRDLAEEHVIEDLGFIPTLLERVEFLRGDAARKIDPEKRSELGQFLTPPPIASFMASLFGPFGSKVRVLDAGAGVGSLFAAFTAEACRREKRPSHIQAVAHEVDEKLAAYLGMTLEACRGEAQHAGVKFTGEIVPGDFIKAAAAELEGGLFASHSKPTFSHAILNPPYKKLNSDAEGRLTLRRLGIETSNLYTAFLALAVKLLADGGELVAITPRSFCNGPYFKSFRESFLGAVSLRRIHVFESRSAAFSDDDVLQENIIFHAVKGEPQGNVIISSSMGPEDEMVASREAPFAEIVRPNDPEKFIHVVADELGQHVAERFHELSASLKDLALGVSTGRVVDFRARSFLRSHPGKDTGPLIYPTHFDKGVVRWPKVTKKPNALVIAPETRALWVPTGTYVLVKRFSSKEEPRRVVAAIFDPKLVPGEQIGFENHLNVYHRDGEGMPPKLARGLAAFLNSTLVDTYFRQFNGHTQVNATDLRNLKYPSARILEQLGEAVGDGALTQDELDLLIEERLNVGTKSKMPDPIQVKKRVDDALSILKSLGLPKEQQNERSALTLLALLDLKPSKTWRESSAPLIGITPMMTFFSTHYGKTYAPNSRETVRRFTVHQFLDAGIIVANPDKPARPVNSPKAVYQIEPGALELLRTFGSPEWEKSLATYVEEYSHE